MYMSTIIGFNSGIHDASVSLIQDGVVKAVYTEERFANNKMKGGTINQSLAYLLRDYRIDPGLVDYFATTTSMILTDRILPDEHDIIKRYRHKIQYYPQHYCHGLGSLIFSNFHNRDDVMVLSLDGGDFNIHNLMYGETIDDKVYDWLIQNQRTPWHESYKNCCQAVDGMLSVYKNGELKIIKQFNSNLFRLYFLGVTSMIYFYKVNGLNVESNLIAMSLKGNVNEHVYRTFRNLCVFNKQTETFDNHVPAECKTKNFEHDRIHDSLLKPLAKYPIEDFCCSLQKCLEDLIMELIDFYQQKYPCKYLCLSGGFFSNIKIIQKLNARSDFDEVFVMPATDDDGTSVGAALAKCIDLGEYKFEPITNVYYGKGYTEKELTKFIKIRCIDYIPYDHQTIIDELKKGKIIGVFRDRAELGPKSLGNRSILADPTNPDVLFNLKNRLNKNQMFPFDISIPEEYVDQILDRDKSKYASEHMTIPYKVKSESIYKISSSVNLDDQTCVPQVVKKEINPWFHTLLQKYNESTGKPGLINATFSSHGGVPIVNSPLHAWECLRDKIIDVLVLGDCIIYA